MATSIIQQLANDLGITSPVNGSWIQAIAEHYGAVTSNGSWIQAWAYEVGATEPANGSWLVAIAVANGITEPLNGSWLSAIEADATSSEWILANGLWSDLGYWDDVSLWIDN
jgi:hypothetical protein